MTEFLDPRDGRLDAYCELYGRRLGRRLGFGKDGTVWATRNATALKIFDRPDLYLQEKRVYLRLTARNASSAAGSTIPTLFAFDDVLGVIEMSIVTPPFVLDFASARLDEPVEFPPNVMDEWQTSKQEEFGANWSRACGVLRALERIGVYMTDVHPGNLRFPESKHR